MLKMTPCYLLTIMLILAVEQSQGCEDPYIEINPTQNATFPACYHIVRPETDVDHAGAEDACKAEGAELFSFYSAEELEAVRNIIRDDADLKKQNFYWVGVKGNPETDWKWVNTGESVKDEVLVWGRNEPSVEREQCVNMVKKGFKLNDAPCKKRGGYICKKETDSSCEVVAKRGTTTSGIYKVLSEGRLLDVYCDLTTDDGGWTVIQRRVNGKVGFFRDWAEYKEGFGNMDEEFWLGNDLISTLTNADDYELRVNMWDKEGRYKYAKYNLFRVANESDLYRLTLGSYSGDAGDSLSFHNGKPFTTLDRDNDSYSKNCAVLYTGAWWYNNCHQSNLNGIYLYNNPTPYAANINWKTWHGYTYSLKKTEMKIRKVSFSSS